MTARKERIVFYGLLARQLCDHFGWKPAELARQVGAQ